eukprot:m.69982 g.69982  ORF g.69982 m.69982 type:complete len:348 (-) comp14280_c0_seq1:325-1368(-)
MTRSLIHEGPQIHDVLEAANGPTIVMWALAACCVVVTLAVYAVHRRQLKSRLPRSSPGRWWTLAIVAMGPVFALTSFASLFFPRVSGVLGVARSFSESLAVYSYVCLLLHKMGGIDGAVAMVRRHRQEYDKYLATPPLCCVCRPCCCEVRMEARLLSLCHKMAMQFVYVVPITGFLSLWVELESDRCIDPEDDHWRVYDTLEAILQITDVCSVLLAMWGLMIIFFASKGAIRDFQPGKKLLAIKLIIFFGMIQSSIINAVISQRDESDPMFFTGATAMNSWLNIMLCFESPMLALLLKSGYPHEPEEYLPLNAADGAVGAPAAAGTAKAYSNRYGAIAGIPGIDTDV